jgi:hypothetical protein
MARNINSDLTALFVQALVFEVSDHSPKLGLAERCSSLTLNALDTASHL